MQVMQRVRKWTEEEDNFIKENYLKMSDEEIGKILDRGERGVSAER